MTMQPMRADPGGSFLPDEYISRRAELRAGILGLGLFGVVMVLVVGAFLVTNQRWRSVRAEASAVQAEYEQQKVKISQLEKLEHERDAMLEKAEIVSALVEKTPRSRLMTELVSRMPPGMTMLELKLDGKRVEPPKPEDPRAKGGPQKVGTLSKGKPDPKAKAPDPKAKPEDAAKPAEAAKPREKIAPPKFDYRLNITGVTPVNSEVTDYLSRLTECGLLQNVDLVYIREADINGLELRKFEITAQLRASPPKVARAAAQNQMATVEQEKPAAASGKE